MVSDRNSNIDTTEGGKPVLRKKRSVIANFAFQSAYQVLLILIPLVTTPYLSRVLGATAVGTFSYTQAIASYFVMFGMLGMSTYGVREVASVGDDRQARTKVFWGAYCSQLIVSLAMCCIYIAYISFLQLEGGMLLGLVWGMYVFSAPIDISWLLFGVEEFKIPTIRSAITKLATLPIIFGFVHGPDDLWIYCAAIAGSLLINQILIWPFARRYVDFALPAWKDIYVHFRPSLVLFVPVIAVSLYTSMDKILLGQLAGMQQAGFFEYSEKLSRMPLAIVTAMGTVMLPRMTSELSAGRRAEALVLLEESVWAMLAMGLALAFGIAAISTEFAPVFLGEEFSDCYVLMQILAVIIPIVSMTNVVGRQYLVPTGRDLAFTFSVCVGAIANLVVNFALIPKFGALGAAIATVAAELSVLIFQVLTVRNELPFGRYIRNAFPFLVIGMLMFFATRAVSVLLIDMFSVGALTLFLEIVFGVAVFIILTVLWCHLTKNEYYEKLLARVIKR